MGLKEEWRRLRDKLKWLDPFTYVDLLIVERVNKRSGRFQAIVFIVCMFFVSIMLHLFVIDSRTPLTFLILVVAVVAAVLYFLYRQEAVAWSIYFTFAFIFALALFGLAGLLLQTTNPMVIVMSGSMEPLMYRGDVMVIRGLQEAGIDAPEVALDMRLEGASLSNYATPYCEGKSTAKTSETLPCSTYIALYRQGKIALQEFSTLKVTFRDAAAIDVTKEGPIVVYYSDMTGEQIIHRVVAKIRASDGVFLLTKGDSWKNPLLDQQAGITSSAVKADSIIGTSIFRIPLAGYLKLVIFDDIPVLLFGCKKPYGCTLP